MIHYATAEEIDIAPKELPSRIYGVSNIRGRFQLRSGKISEEYFDKYLFEGNPEILREIASEMSRLLPPSFDFLGGLELGGVPIATMISHFSGKPVLFVRKKAKEYGTCRLAEGGEVSGKRIVIIEDVVSTGGAVIESVLELRKLGAIIDRALCVIDRETGGSEKLKENGIHLTSLFTSSELKASADSKSE